jgi:hypothetical protein
MDHHRPLEVFMADDAIKQCERYLVDPNKPDEVSNEMTIEMARFYYRNDYPDPKLNSPPSIDRITYAWRPKKTFTVFFVSGEAVGVSYEHLEDETLIVACKVTSRGCVDRYFYSFSCPDTGSPVFKKKFYRRDAFDSRHPVSD